jgi:F-type H+-transporting ATPase subunit b
VSTTSLAANNFLLPNGTFIAELVAFLVILLVLWKFVIPPLNDALRERQEMARRLVEDSEEANRRLKAAREGYDQALAEARVEAARIRDAARADGARIREELRARAVAEVENIRRRGEQQLVIQRDRVVRELSHEVGDLAVRLTERILRYELSDDEHRRAVVDSFLAELAQLPASRPAR